MAASEHPIVVGGGAAGLAACLTLEAAGHAPILLESSNRLGGRLHTERMEDGTAVDRGFQVLLTAYPEFQRWFDPDNLDLVAFVPGAMIRKGGRWKIIADPRRLPGSLPATLTSGVGTWRDRFRILRLVGEACGGSPESIQNGLTEGSTMDFLRARGFSEGFMRDFLKPFFSGIFLDAALAPPPAQFLYTLRMFASGAVVRPRGGIETLVEDLAGRLMKTEVRLSAEVVRSSKVSVQLQDGTHVLGAGVISSVERRHDVQWNSAFNAVFSCQTPSFGRPIIGLIPEAKWVTNMHFMEDIQGEAGRGKLNVTALPQAGAAVDVSAMEKRVRADLDMAGITTGDLLWHALIPQALPRLQAVSFGSKSVRNREGVYGVGDHLVAPSLDAALRSGRLAAEAWLDTNR